MTDKQPETPAEAQAGQPFSAAPGSATREDMREGKTYIGVAAIRRFDQADFRSVILVAGNIEDLKMAWTRFRACHDENALDESLCRMVIVACADELSPNAALSEVADNRRSD